MSISSEIIRIQGAKTALKTAIEDKGVAVPQTAKIEDYAGFVEEIEQGGGGSSYSYTTGKIRGLQDLGWDEESIGSYNDNLGFYSWQGGSVSEANKALYGVVNASNYRNYSGNTDMEYLPTFTNSGIRLENFKYLKGCPKITFSGGGSRNLFAYFKNCSNLIVAPLMDTSEVDSTSSMFQSCTHLKVIPQYDMSKVTSASVMFGDCSSLKNLPEMDLSSCRDTQFMFSGCLTLDNVKLINTGKINDTSSMFNNCSRLTSIEMDLASCTRAGSMFSGCKGLKTVNLSNTEKIQNASYMFQSCSGLTSVNLNISACTNAASMFEGCSGLTSVNLNISACTNAASMFEGCSGLTNITLTNTSNLQNVKYMFSKCTGLTSLPELDFGNVTAMTSFFGASGTMSRLTDLGGFKNLKCNWNDNYGLYKCNNLTVQSLLNVLNDLYDFTGHSETPTSSQGKLKLGSANYNKLTAEQIAIGTNKGWQILQ